MTQSLKERLLAGNVVSLDERRKLKAARSAGEKMQVWITRVVRDAARKSQDQNDV